MSVQLLTFINDVVVLHANIMVSICCYSRTLLTCSTLVFIISFVGYIRPMVLYSLVFCLRFTEFLFLLIVII